jgi:hypothetical protein
VEVFELLKKNFIGEQKMLETYEKKLKSEIKQTSAKLVKDLQEKAEKQFSTQM